ncbi:MAG: DUF4097 family beta strand repeat protein [Christensenellaceae bacterium]|nr:DUF4097 family beta strand repeat protein [Christensenellaceae bacterium]
MKKILALVLVFALVLSVGCIRIGDTSYLYRNAEKYSVGDSFASSEEIENIEISWVSGKVTVQRSEGNAIEFSEKGRFGLTEGLRLHYFIEGNTLLIKFAESGRWDFRKISKDLTISIPDSAQLKDLCIETISADIEIEEAVGSKLTVSSVSGDIEAEKLLFHALSLTSVSGDIELPALADPSEMELSTLSGDITAKMLGASTSFVHERSFDVSTTSGNIKLDFAGFTPEEGEISSVSGKILLKLPKDSSFTAEVETVSGDFDCAFKTVKADDQYIAGDGSCEYNFETVSGDIEIKKS